MDQIGRWTLVRSLGRGGQGEVFLVKDRSAEPDESKVLFLLQQALETLTAQGLGHSERRSGADLLLSVIREVVAADRAPLAALKRLHTPDAKSHSRLGEELGVLSQITHPAIIRVLDSHAEEGWFVAPYFERGTLGDQLSLNAGSALDALARLRPVVEAVAKLHSAGFVHRDIKPENMFVDSSGGLVLGDCGLAFSRNAPHDRITDTGENVGSRDWMPGWAMGMRVDDVRPSFDVFCLGKVLWAMVSGRSRLRLWYHRSKEFNLESQFPSVPGLVWVNRLLDSSVVEHESDCLPDAGALLECIDEASRALQWEARPNPASGSMKCVACGLGTYELAEDFARKLNVNTYYRLFFCGRCGHSRSFRADRAKLLDDSAAERLHRQ